MKEGYLQLKITELNDKISKLEELIKFENRKLELMQENIGTYKEVIKKFRDLEKFKEESLNEIRKENEDLIDQKVQEVEEKLERTHNELVSSKSLDINRILTNIEKREQHIMDQTETLEQLSKDVAYLLEYNELFMMKLANKNILSYREIDEMKRRAGKKANQQK